MKKKKRNKDSNKYLIITIIFVVITLILLFLSSMKDKNQPTILDELEKEGFSTKIDDIYYKNILTNNTIDEYYDDIKNGINSEYEEYYITKDTHDFIELKMYYKDKVNSVLNINSLLKSEEIKYNYEISYNKSRLLIEGTYKDTFICKPIIKDNIKDETLDNICNNIKNEINIYIDRKKEMLSNKDLKRLA